MRTVRIRNILDKPCWLAIHASNDEAIIGFVFARQGEHGTWCVEGSIPIDPVPKRAGINLFRIDGLCVPPALQHYDPNK